MENQPIAIQDRHIEDYLAKEKSDYVSSSGMKQVLISPRHYQAAKTKPKPATDSMNIGTAAHMDLLEPEKYANSYVVLRNKDLPNPTKDFRNAENKAYKESFISENAGKVIISENDWDQVAVMVQNAMSLPMVRELFKPGTYTSELSHYFHIDELNGRKVDMPGKIRVDYLHNTLPIFLDIKTTKDASPKGFLREYNNYQYQLQIAYYFDMLNRFFPRKSSNGESPAVIDCYILAIENVYPYMAQIYRIPDEDLKYGRYLYTAAIDRLVQANELGVWHGYELNAGFEGGVIKDYGVLELKTPDTWYLEIII